MAPMSSDLILALKDTLRYGLFLGTFAGTFVSVGEVIAALGGHRRYDLIPLSSQLGIRTIPVSTTLSFTSIIVRSFPPSASEFIEPVNTVIITPLLQFLEEMNSSFLKDPFNFRDDFATGVRYWNLFDMMVDRVVAVMAVIGWLPLWL